MDQRPLPVADLGADSAGLSPDAPGLTGSRLVAIRPTVLSDLTGSTGGSEVHYAALRVLTRVVGSEKILRRSG